MPGLLDFINSDLAGDIGMGLLSQSGPVVGAPAPSIGQAFAHSMQYANSRDIERMQLQAMRDQMTQQKRRGDAITELQAMMGSNTTIQGPTTSVAGMGGESIGSIPGYRASVPTIATPQGQQQMMGLLADVAPEQFVHSMIEQGSSRPQGYEGTTGQLINNIDLAVARGDTVAADTFRQQLETGLQGAGVNIDDVFKARNDVIKNSEDFLAAQQGFDRVRIGATAGTPAGDVATVFGFMKTIDPQSVVREGEFATAENTASVPERIRRTYNQLLTGQRLTPEQRADFLSQAKQQFSAFADQQNKLIEDYSLFAKRNKLSAEDVIPAYLIPVMQEYDAPVLAQPGAGLQEAAAETRKLGAEINAVFDFDPSTGKLVPSR